MFVFIVRRVLISIPLIFVVMIGLFFLQQLAPGDASALYINPEFPIEQIERIRANLGLDQPSYVQFWRWFTAALSGDFGISLTENRPVIDKIIAALPNTLLLGGASLAVIFLIGIVVGVVSAVKQYSLTDHLLTLGSFFLYSMPGFWLALMLILVTFHLWPDWPSSGMVSNEITMKLAHIREAAMLGEEPEVSIGMFERFFDTLKHLVLPVIALGVASAASIARYTRSSVLEVIRQDFVRTARAKGVSERRVILVHTLRNALIPIVTLLGLSLPFLVSGAVLIEYVFAWPGMGRELVEGIFKRDYPIVMACALLLTIMVFVGNLAADILYSLVDPRISHG